MGFYWIILDSIGFYWILLGFTGFYWVLPSFTGFYWVLPGELVRVGLVAGGEAALLQTLFQVLADDASLDLGLHVGLVDPQNLEPHRRQRQRGSARGDSARCGHPFLSIGVRFSSSKTIAVSTITGARCACVFTWFICDVSSETIMRATSMEEQSSAPVTLVPPPTGMTATLWRTASGIRSRTCSWHSAFPEQKNDQTNKSVTTRPPSVQSRWKLEGSSNGQLWRNSVLVASRMATSHWTSMAAVKNLKRIHQLEIRESGLGPVAEINAS